MSDASPPGWNPERSWVLVVGILEWQHADLYHPFPQENRRDAALVDLFLARGVPPAQVLYLKDSAATLKAVDAALGTHLAGASEGDTLFLYFCGHGSREDGGTTYFATHDAGSRGNLGWSVGGIVPAIDRHFRGQRALLLADCCYSGALADAVSGSSGRVAYASLASSSASELSTGNWTFTEQVLAGLRGEAFEDADGSGQITLLELADQIAASMAFAEEQLASFAVGAGFDPHTVLARAKPRPDPQVGRRVEVESQGDWYPAQIVDAQDGEWKVHYFGYEESDDEWVGSDRMRERVQNTYAVGSAVEVQWKKKWYPARVLSVMRGVHHIAYDGFGPEWNESVSSKRIRPLSGHRSP